MCIYIARLQYVSCYLLVVVVIIVVVAVTIHVSYDISRKVNANEHETNEAEGGEFLSWRTWSFTTATCKLRLSV